MTLIEDITPEEFVASRMSHNSAEEFFSTIGVDIASYIPTHLSITHIEPINDNFSNNAELKLAKRAIGKGCEYATNLDYCQFRPQEGFMILAGTGWLLK